MLADTFKRKQFEAGKEQGKEQGKAEERQGLIRALSNQPDKTYTADEVRRLIEKRSQDA